MLLTVFPEDSEHLKEYEAYTKKTPKRYTGRSILPKMHTPRNEEMQWKDHFRTRFDLRRKADKREMGDPASMRKAPRRQQVSRRWRPGQALSRIRGSESDDE